VAETGRPLVNTRRPPAAARRSAFSRDFSITACASNARHQTRD
jgi:hypothetical protein